MNLEKLKKQLMIDEGYKLEVYLDSEGLPTFGIGHLLLPTDIEYYSYKNLKNGGKLIISKERVDEVFKKDVVIACDDCRIIFSDFDKMPDEIQQILVNMMFNLGRPRFSAFKKFIAAIKDKNYKIAALEMKDSRWFRQVGDRSKRLFDRMDRFANDYLCNFNNSTL